MNEKHTERYSAAELDQMEDKTDWERVDRLTDEEIEAAAAEDPDAEVLPEDWFEKAELIMPAQEKVRITIRLNRGVVEYFRGQGEGYQSRINAVLRAYVHSQRKRAAG